MACAHHCFENLGACWGLVTKEVSLTAKYGGRVFDGLMFSGLSHIPGCFEWQLLNRWSLFAHLSMLQCSLWPFRAFAIPFEATNVQRSPLGRLRSYV